MKKVLFNMVLLICLVLTAFAQNQAVDKITLTSGKEVSAIVKEILPSEIKYVASNNVDGPLITMPKKEIASIVYANGVEEVFSANQTLSGSSAPGISANKVFDSYKGRTSEDPNAKEFEFDDRRNSSTPIVNYGIDFTLVKFIGSSGFSDPSKIVDVYLEKINQKIIMEQDKYDMGIIFRRRDFDIDLDMLSGRNRSINPYEVVTNSNHTISEEQINGLVASYNPQAQEGIGLVIVMESLNKLRERGEMYFVLFDIKTKKVVHIRKESGEPSGFGITNYWMKPVYEAIKKLKRAYR